MKKDNKHKLLTSAILGFGFLFLAFGSGDTKKDKNSESSCNYVTSLDEVKNCAVGVWIARPVGEIWKRIVLKADGTYDLFASTPVSGSWSSVPEHSGTYEIAEARFSDTGKKYIYISLNNSGLCSYRMVFDGTASLECNGNYDVMDKGDFNPWE